MTTTRTRWGARLATATITAGLVGMTLPVTASAASSPNPFVEGGQNAVKSGTTVPVSFPPFALDAGENWANRTVHAYIVDGVANCNPNGSRLASPKVTAAVPAAGLGLPYIASMAIPSRVEFAQIDNYFLCAFQLGEVSSNGRLSRVASDYVIWDIQAGPNTPAPNNAVAPTLPGTPVLVSGGNATGVPVNGRVVVSVALIAPPARGDALGTREVLHSVVNSANVANCSGGAAPTTNRIGANNLSDISLAITYPQGRAGQYLCVEQSVTTTQHPNVRRSTPLLLPITQAAINPALGNTDVKAALGSALSRVQDASRNLSGLLAAAGGNVNAPEVAGAIQEAQAAQEELQAARAAEALADPANAVNQNDNQGGVIANAASDAPVNAAADALREQLDATVGSTTVNLAPGVTPTLFALASATGFDPLTTPVLAEGKGNKAGIKLSVTKPRKIMRGKGFSVTLNVDPKATRGGMRQYLLRMDGDQPTLVHKRSGFITTGKRAKRYWISPKAAKGTYALVSTFQPSVPGTPGLSIVTPLTVK